MRVHGALLVTVCVLGSTARADDIATVKISDAGPDRPIPVGAAFYVEGSAKSEVTRIQAIVVRTGSPWIVGGASDSCAKVGKTLRPELLDKKVVAKVTTLGALFPKAGVPDVPTAASNAWERGELEGDKDFKLLVPDEKGFYQAGHTYCLFVLESKRLVDDEVFAVLLVTLGDAKAKCTTAACVTAAETTFDKDAQKAAATLTAEQAKTLRTNASSLVGIVTSYYTARAQVVTRVSLRGGSPPPTAQPAAWARIDNTAASDGLARFLANRLTVTPDGLLAAPTPAVGGAPGQLAKYTNDAAFEVKQLKILADGLKIQVAANVITPALQPKLVTATTDKVLVAPNVTVRDILLLVDDRVFINKKEWRLADLSTALGRVSLRASAKDFEFVTASRTRMAELHDAMELIQRTALMTKTGADSLPAIFDDLDAWLLGHTFKKDELAKQANAIGTMADERATWESKKADVNITTDVYLSRTVASVPVRFDQRTWVFSYLTPFIGYANTQDGVTELYTGVQLHIRANPFNEPLWKNGRWDLFRAFAIEFGIAPTGSPFGPDKRYSGITDSIPPLFVGFALHIVPYTSLTVGGVWLSKRASALPAEEPQREWQGYVGLNVQPNIPDLIRELMTPSTNTTVEK